VPDTLWEQNLDNDIWFYSGCHQGNTPGCYYPPDGVTSPSAIVTHFEAVANDLCMATAVPEHASHAGPLLILTEPDGSAIVLPGTDPRAVVQVIDAAGRPVRVQRQGDRVIIGHLATGTYSVVVSTTQGVRHGRFVR
jgi:hypothetical protein